ncbi:hypothetical protein FIU66_10065 [Paracoccus sp. AK26]|nr:hypothetical protein FIU66_10065 [Paracoccus sp. AK26]
MTEISEAWCNPVRPSTGPVGRAGAAGAATGGATGTVGTTTRGAAGAAGAEGAGTGAGAAAGCMQAASPQTARSARTRGMVRRLAAGILDVMTASGTINVDDGRAGIDIGIHPRDAFDPRHSATFQAAQRTGCALVGTGGRAGWVIDQPPAEIAPRDGADRIGGEGAGLVKVRHGGNAAGQDVVGGRATAGRQRQKRGQ